MPNYTDTWSSWCSTDTSTPINDSVWYAWNTNTTDATTNTTDCSNNRETIWLAWTTQSTDCSSNSVNNYRPVQSQEQRNRIEHERQQHEAEAKQAKKDRIAARKRAMKLLLTNLTNKQKEQFNKHQFFIVEGGKSKRKYRIRSDKQKTNLPMANIDVLHYDNDNNVDHKICFHLSYGIPLGDQLLAQKLMLENDEDRALEVSNRHAA